MDDPGFLGFHNAADQIAVPRLLALKDEMYAIADVIYDSVDANLVFGTPFPGLTISGDKLLLKLAK
jgi:hypothetical protein